MAIDNKELIQKLNFAIEMIEKARYYPLFGKPAASRRFFVTRLPV
jgi:hypothetical protein